MKELKIYKYTKNTKKQINTEFMAGMTQKGLKQPYFHCGSLHLFSLWSGNYIQVKYSPSSVYDFHNTKGIKLLTQLRLIQIHLGRHTFQDHFQYFINYLSTSLKSSVTEVIISDLSRQLQVLICLRSLKNSTEICVT